MLYRPIFIKVNKTFAFIISKYLSKAIFYNGLGVAEQPLIKKSTNFNRSRCLSLLTNYYKN